MSTMTDNVATSMSELTDAGLAWMATDETVCTEDERARAKREIERRRAIDEDTRVVRVFEGFKAA